MLLLERSAACCPSFCCVIATAEERAVIHAFLHQHSFRHSQLSPPSLLIPLTECDFSFVSQFSHARILSSFYQSFFRCRRTRRIDTLRVHPSARPCFPRCAIAIAVFPSLLRCLSPAIHCSAKAPRIDGTSFLRPPRALSSGPTILTLCLVYIPWPGLPLCTSNHLFLLIGSHGMQTIFSIRTDKRFETCTHFSDLQFVQVWYTPSLQVPSFSNCSVDPRCTHRLQPHTHIGESQVQDFGTSLYSDLGAALFSSKQPV